MRVIGLDRAPRWNPIWDGNPRFAPIDARGNFQTIQNCGGMRPYIAGRSGMRWSWRRFECTPGEIYFSAAEASFAAPYAPEIIIEPNIKPGASPNKQWGWSNWHKLAAILIRAGYSVSQIGPVGTRVLAAACFIQTQDFRRGCAILSKARLYIGPDGGLHHAAAALGVPAIVIRGGFISHECTGYAGQRNFFTGHGLGCGMRTRCSCCAQAMGLIKPEAAFEAACEMLACEFAQ